MMRKRNLGSVVKKLAAFSLAFAMAGAGVAAAQDYYDAGMSGGTPVTLYNTDGSVYKTCYRQPNGEIVCDGFTIPGGSGGTVVSGDYYATSPTVVVESSPTVIYDTGYPTAGIIYDYDSYDYYDYYPSWGGSWGSSWHWDRPSYRPPRPPHRPGPGPGIHRPRPPFNPGPGIGGPKPSRPRPPHIGGPSGNRPGKPSFGPGGSGRPGKGGGFGGNRGGNRGGGGGGRGPIRIPRGK